MCGFLALFLRVLVKLPVCAVYLRRSIGRDDVAGADVDRPRRRSASRCRVTVHYILSRPSALEVVEALGHLSLVADPRAAP